MEVFKGLINDNQEKFNDYQKNKLKYLNEVHQIRRTQEVYWGVFQRFVLYHEINKKKDLYEFNKEEVEEILKSIPTTSVRTRRAAWTAIDQYLKWAYERELNITGNVCKEIEIEEILNVSSKMLSKKFYSLDETYRICAEAEKNGSPCQEIIALLLARYGVLGKESSWLINLKYEDIDFEYSQINIFDRSNGEENLLTSLPIDSRLSSWLEKAKNEDGYEVRSKGEGTRFIKYYDNGYVLKTSKEYLDVIDNMVLYGYLKRVSKNARVKKISLTDLVRCRKFDILKEIKETCNRDLDVNDFKLVSKLFSPDASYSTYSSLLKDYKLMTGEEIIKLK